MECKRSYLESLMEGLFEKVTVTSKEEEEFYTNKEEDDLINEIKEEDVELQKMILLDRENRMLEIKIFNVTLHQNIIRESLEQKSQMINSLHLERVLKLKNNNQPNERHIERMFERNIEKIKYSYLYFQIKPSLGYIYNLTTDTYKLNNRWNEEFGYELLDLKGNVMEKYIHPKDRVIYNNLINISERSLKSTIRFRHKDGHYKCMKCRIIHHNRLGQELYFVKIEKYPMRGVLVETNEQLKDRIIVEKNRNQFFSTISHEFKTPLNIILSSTTLIKQILKENELEDDIGFKKILKLIEKSSRKILQISNDLVDLTQLDIAEYKLECGYHNIVDVVEGALMYSVEYINQTSKMEMDITFDTDVEEKIIWCDDKEIERVIFIVMNFIVNNKCLKGTKVQIHDLGKAVEIEVATRENLLSDQQTRYLEDGNIKTDSTYTRHDVNLSIRIAKKIILLHNGKIKITHDECKNSIKIKIPTYENRYSYIIKEDSLKDRKERCQTIICDLDY